MTDADRDALAKARVESTLREVVAKRLRATYTRSPRFTWERLSESAKGRWRHDAGALLVVLGEDLVALLADLRAAGWGDVRALSMQCAHEHERRQAAEAALAALGLVEHAGTWITREEADRISRDGP